jgi:diguanylate cyclase (GGDEF)-like protein
MFNWIADGMVIAATCLLCGALLPVRRLIAQLPSGVLHQRWRILSALIVLFICAYIGYGAKFWFEHKAWHDLIVPSVFLFGAAFVWLTTQSALQTIMDICRLSVLEQENITDPLIGIYNRRYLDLRLAEEFAKARRYDMALSVLMLDIDFFKRVNDSYGHQVGDLVLRHIGKQVLSAIRNSDILGRYGGEELVVIAPGTDASQAMALAERVRQCVEMHPLILADKQEQAVNVTISIGVSTIKADIADSGTLLGEADEALYSAKDKGRNRVETLEGLSGVKADLVIE